MLENLIPEHIDFLRVAEQKGLIEGIVQLNEMQRLAANMIFPLTGNAEAKLQFALDDHGVPFIEGSVKTELVLECQRCLQPINYEIMTAFVLGIVSTIDEANALPAHYEPALAKEGQLALRELIEDEIILNLPIVPRHEVNKCKVSLTALYTEDENESDKKGPFHVLKALKNQTDN